MESVPRQRMLRIHTILFRLALFSFVQIGIKGEPRRKSRRPNQGSTKRETEMRHRNAQKDSRRPGLPLCLQATQSSFDCELCGKYNVFRQGHGDAPATVRERESGRVVGPDLSDDGESKVEEARGTRNVV